MYHYLFFDTETTGLKPRHATLQRGDLHKWPHIVQLAFILTDERGATVAEYSTIIRPDGWQVPEEAARVHGITTERAMAEGIGIDEALDKFMGAVGAADCVVCHNYEFDAHITGAELARYYWRLVPPDVPAYLAPPSNDFQVKLLNKPNHCTMKESTLHCDLPGPYGPKWPKLEELYDILFSGTFDGAHDALNDVRATVKCFFELKRIGVIKS